MHPLWIPGTTVAFAMSPRYFTNAPTLDFGLGLKNETISMDGLQEVFPLTMW